jgi:Flp pilus assembly pilin Flp
MGALKTRLFRYHSRFRVSTTAQSYVEYAMIIALVSLAVTAALAAWSGRISDAFANLGRGL